MKDGGPAFPRSITIGEENIDLYGEILDKNSTHYYGGMTLRDYFAAKAMQAILNQGGALGAVSKTGNAQDVCARMAYAFADAMLAERDKERT